MLSRISIPGSIRKPEVVMIHKTLATILTIPLLASVLSAQAPKTQALLMAMGANGKQMKSYQWKQKTTVIRKGSPLEPMLDELRFDATGQIQRITLIKPEEKKMGPLRARKAAEVKDSIQHVMQLARRYASPQLLSDAIRKGEIWEGPHMLRVQARSVLVPSDENDDASQRVYLSRDPNRFQDAIRRQPSRNRNRLSAATGRPQHDDAVDSPDSQGRHHRQCGVV